VITAFTIIMALALLFLMLFSGLTPYINAGIRPISGMLISNKNTTVIRKVSSACPAAGGAGGAYAGGAAYG
jgi:uncharacterized paraquat-inducible protein A